MRIRRVQRAAAAATEWRVPQGIAGVEVDRGKYGGRSESVPHAVWLSRVNFKAQFPAQMKSRVAIAFWANESSNNNNGNNNR